MAQPYVGEIRMFAGNFAPAGWMFCEGQLLPISENETLFQLIGTTYGGDGQSTFALPDLRGRLPLHQGNGFILVLCQTGLVAEDVKLVEQVFGRVFRQHSDVLLLCFAQKVFGCLNISGQGLPFKGLGCLP